MPTHEQRAQSISDAVLNKSAAAAHVNRIGQALAFQCGFLVDYNLMSPEDRAAFFVDRVRRHVVDLVKRYDEQVAAELAKAQATEAVDTEFAESP